MYRKLMIGLVFILCIGIVSADDLTTDIKAYYTFDNVITDSVGSNDLNNTGATYTASGKINGAYDYSSDYMSVPDDVRPSGNFSFSVWAKADTFGSHNNIFGNQGSNKGIIMRVSSNKGYFLIGDGSDWQYVASSTISTGSFHHYVGTYDGTNIQLWINNVSQGTKAQSQPQYDVGLAVGSWNSDAPNLYWDGVIDELSFWDRVLNSSEISELYNSGSGLQYPFGVSEGDDCDYSGSGDWIIDETCTIDTDSNLETGKSLFVTAGNTAFVSSGVAVT